MFVRLRLGPVVLLPRFGARVCAGFPSPADDYIEDDVDLTRLVVGNPLATFLWTAQGECMVGAGIFDGDILVPTGRSIRFLATSSLRSSTASLR